MTCNNVERILKRNKAANKWLSSGLAAEDQEVMANSQKERASELRRRIKWLSSGLAAEDQ
jgi:hypothetical protein